MSTEDLTAAKLLLSEAIRLTVEIQAIARTTQHARSGTEAAMHAKQLREKAASLQQTVDLWARHKPPPNA